MNIFIKKILKDDSGFTLIELVIVIVIISIIAMTAGPGIIGFFGNKRENFAILTGVISKTFDDSFLNNKINYLSIHLYEPMEDSSEEEVNDVFRRDNGVSVLNLVDGKFIDNKKKIFKYKNFSDDFKFESVLLKNKEEIYIGNVLIPFYPQGNSDNVIIHILVNDEDKYSVRIFKHRKEPEVFTGYKTFDDEY